MLNFPVGLLSASVWLFLAGNTILEQIITCRLHNWRLSLLSCINYHANHCALLHKIKVASAWHEGVFRCICNVLCVVVDVESNSYNNNNSRFATITVLLY